MIGRNAIRTTAFAGLLGLLAACGGGGSELPPPPPATTGGATTQAAAGTAKVTGKVTFEGSPPAGTKADLSADPNCEKTHGGGSATIADVEVGPEGGLAGVVVKIAGAKGPARTEPAVLDQHGCLYTPRVVAVQVGQPLKVKNSDPFMHNVNMHASANPPQNLAMPNVMEKEIVFQKPEVIETTCDIHGWMKSWVVVLETPFFAVTGPDGSFSIVNLPAGTYTVEAWHPTLGTKTAEVTVAEGGSAEVAIAFQG